MYQDNVYASNRQFHSFKKVTREMGDPYDKLELASFLSCSKGIWHLIKTLLLLYDFCLIGYMGECGLRGGYSEIVNMDPAVKALYLKSISAKLCPTGKNNHPSVVIMLVNLLSHRLLQFLVRLQWIASSIRPNQVSRRTNCLPKKKQRSSSPWLIGRSPSLRRSTPSRASSAIQYRGPCTPSPRYFR